MALPKPVGAWTYEDLFTLPDDGRRYEIIDGVLYEMPSPRSVHAFTIALIVVKLYPILAQLGGRIASAPLDVFFAGANPVQPDVVAILPSGAARVVERGVEGAPDLVIEVLSPSNRDHDLLTKRGLYARGGVREYWIIDPEARTVEILALKGHALHLSQFAAVSDVLVSPLLGAIPGIVDELFPALDA